MTCSTIMGSTSGLGQGSRSVSGTHQGNKWGHVKQATILELRYKIKGRVENDPNYCHITEVCRIINRDSEKKVNKVGDVHQITKNARKLAFVTF